MQFDKNNVSDCTNQIKTNYRYSRTALNESNLHQNKFKHFLKCLSQAYLAQTSFLFYSMVKPNGWSAVFFLWLKIVWCPWITLQKTILFTYGLPLCELFGTGDCHCNSSETAYTGTLLCLFVLCWSCLCVFFSWGRRLALICDYGNYWSFCMLVFFFYKITIVSLYTYLSVYC